MFCTRWSFAIDLFSNVLFQTFHYFWKLDLLSCWFHCVEMFYIEFRMRETFTVIPRFEFYWLKHRINLDLKTKSWDYIKSEYNHESYLHCVKSVQIRSYFWSIFSCIQSEYRKYSDWVCWQEVKVNVNTSFLSSLIRPRNKRCSDVFRGHRKGTLT